MKKIKKKKVLSTRDGIASDLLACKQAFDQVQIPWVIIDGIVLGYVRRRDILPWDTDLDAGIFGEISSTKWFELFTALKGVGFSLKNLKKDFVFGRRRVKLNLWLYHKKGKFYESFPHTTPGVKFVEKEIWFGKPQLVEFLGLKYPVPDNVEDYVIHHYGSDWKKEKTSHDVWRKEKFGTSTGRFKSATWLDSRCGPKGDLWPRIMKVNDIL